MSTTSPSSHEEVPSFDGDPSKWRQYELRAKGFAAGLDDNKRSTAGPRLYNRLHGVAWEKVTSTGLDPEILRKDGGLLTRRKQYI